MQRPIPNGVAFAAIAIVAAALRALFFSGYILSDDVYYIHRTLELASGDLTPPTSYFAARIGLVGPAALSVAAFGVNKLAVVAWPMACSMVSLWVAWRLGARLFDETTGLLAAALLACYPLELIFASHLFACTPSGLLVAAAVLCWLTAEERGDSRLAFAAGAVLGTSLLVHETAVMYGAFLVPYWVWIRRPGRPVAWAAAGLVLACGLDPVLNVLLGGEPTTRLAILLSSQNARGLVAQASGAGWSADWLLRPWFRLLTEQELALFPLFAVPATALSLRRHRDWRERALAVFVAGSFLWISYGSVSPLTYAPLVRLPRYLTGLTIPVVVLIAAHLQRLGSARLRWAALAVLCSSGLLGATLDNGRVIPKPFDALHAQLAADPPERVVVDRITRIPLLLAAGGCPPYELAVFTDRTLAEVRTRCPDTREPTPFDPERDRVVAVYASEARRSFREDFDATPVATFPRPFNLYEKVLAHPEVLELLALGRDEWRMDALRDRSRPQVELFHLSGR